MEEIRHMKPIQHIMYCDKCGIGEMKPTGIIFTSFPEQYQHVCDECGYVETYYKKYPYIEYIIDNVNY